MASIGDLVANLGVNTAPWSQGLGKARNQFSSFTSGISSMIAPLAATIGGVWGVKSSVSAYSEALTQARKLESVLQATGGAAGLTSQQIADYAGELQSVTNFEDDATVGAAAMLASFTNIKGDVFKDALAAAADLTAVMGGDLQTNVKLLGKALNDPAEGLAKLARAGIQFTESQTAQIAALQASGDMLGAQGIILDVVQNKFGGAAKATADPLTQLSNTVGDVAENIGSAFLPAISVGAEALTGLLGTVVGGADAFKEFGIEAAVQLSHIGAYVLLTATNWELAFVQIGAETSHFFTESLPAYFKWFQDNALNIAVTFGSNYVKIYENIGSNIKSVMTEVWDYVKSGGTDAINFTMTDLRDGFINTIGALPDVPARVVGDYEKSLQASIEAQAESIGESIDAQRKSLEEKFSPLKTAPVAGNTDFEEFGKAEKEKTAKAAKDLSNKAALQGSSEAASILLRGVGGGAKSEKLGPKLDTLIAVTKQNKPEDPPDVAGVV